MTDLTAQHIADRWGVSVDSVARLISTGTFPGAHLGNVMLKRGPHNPILIPLSDVIAYEAARHAADPIRS